MTPAIIYIWIFGGVLAAAGITLVLLAWGASARRLGAEPPRIGELRGACHACGYSTVGLEQELCPECGRTFLGAARMRARRRRVALAGAGVAMLSGAAACVPMAEASRFGWPHIAPGWVLVQMAGWSPELLPAMSGALRVRAQAGLLSVAERREVATVCERIIGGTTDGVLRREAAWVLGTVGDSATDACIMRLLQDRDAVLRAEGVRAAMGGRSAPRASSAWVIKRLVTMAGSDRSAIVRKLALDTVRVAGSGEAARLALRNGMQDDDEGVRRRALIGLTVESPADWGTIEAAIIATRDADEGTRRTAIWALERWRDARLPGRAQGAAASVTPLLAAMAIGDEDAEVRAEAWSVLGTIRG